MSVSIALISDIHGNESALRAVLREVSNHKIDAIVNLGDSVGYYSRVNETCDLLRTNGVISLMGNHDYYMVNDISCHRSHTVDLLIQYQKSIMNARNLRWLAELPKELSFKGIRMVHGGWNDFLEEYLVPSSGYFAKLKGEIFASGHTHVPLIFQEDGKMYCNPGSVGQPRDGNPKASFALFQNGQFRIIRVEYDIDETIYFMRKAGFPSRLYDNLKLGLGISKSTNS
jgi:predicted phosphodiesterase